MRTLPRDVAEEVEPAEVAQPGPPAPPEEAAQRPRSMIGRAADWTTLLGVFLAPLYGKAIGGINGIAYADIALGLAMMIRVVDLLMGGVRPGIIKRQSFLLGLMSVIAVDGIVTALIAGRNPLQWEFDRIIIATVTTVLLVATYGTQDRAARRHIVVAFVTGATVLAFTSFGGLRLNGRPLGWSTHPNALGHSCMMGTFAALWLVDNSSKRLERLCWAGAAGLNVIAIMNSGSRGGFLGLAAGGLVYLLRSGNRRMKLGAIFCAWMAVAIVMGGIVHLPANNPITRLLTSHQANTSSGLSDQARNQLLADDLAKITHHPILGVGFHDIWLVHVAYLQPWVGAGAAAGLMGMLIGLAMLLLPWVTRRRDVALACAATAVAIAWLMTNIFTLRDQWIVIALAFANADSISVLGRSREDRREALG